MSTLGTMVIGSAEALRAYLDEFNELGIDDRVVGIDNVSQPFLACLTGIYGDSENVITCDPRDLERDQGEYCEDCGQATKLSGLEVLNYPVTVLCSAAAS